MGTKELAHANCLMGAMMAELGMKEDAHGGGCQFDFRDKDRTVLACRLNPGHRVILYNGWRSSTMEEMLGMDILVGAAKEEAQQAQLQKTKPAE